MKAKTGRDWNPFRVDQLGPVTRVIVDHTLVDSRDGEVVKIVGTRCPWYLWVESTVPESSIGGVSVIGFSKIPTKSAPMWTVQRVRSSETISNG